MKNRCVAFVEPMVPAACRKVPGFYVISYVLIRHDNLVAFMVQVCHPAARFDVVFSVALDATWYTDLKCTTNAASTNTRDPTVTFKFPKITLNAVLMDTKRSS